MKTGKGQMRFGLHAGSSEHSHASLASLAGGFSKQTRLPDPRLAADDQRLATRCDLIQERRHQPLLVCATEQGPDLATNGPGHERLILSLRARRGARINDEDGRESSRLTSHPRSRKAQLVARMLLRLERATHRPGAAGRDRQRRRADLSKARREAKAAPAFSRAVLIDSQAAHSL